MLDILILAFLVIGLWQGFHNGLLRSLVGLFGWLFALLFATYFAKPLAPLFASMVDEPILQVVAAFIAVALAMIVGLQVILWLMSRTLKGLKLSILDKLAGAIFAVGKNLLIIMLLISVLAPFVSNWQVWRASNIAPALVSYAPFAVGVSKQLSKEVGSVADKGIEQLDKLSKSSASN